MNKAPEYWENGFYPDCSGTDRERLKELLRDEKVQRLIEMVKSGSFSGGFIEIERPRSSERDKISAFYDSGDITIKAEEVSFIPRTYFHRTL